MDFEQLKSGTKRVRMAVACAADPEVMEAAILAWRESVVEPILFGCAAWMHAYLLSQGLGDVFELVDGNEEESVARAVLRVREGGASLLMKGMVPTGTLMRSVLRREGGVRGGGFLSHVGAFVLPGREGFYLLTDAALNIAPTLEEKAKIVTNALGVAQALGMPRRVVACLCAVEQPTERMPATMDAVALSRMQWNNAEVSGPLALDVALFEDLAEHKGIKDATAGHCNILLAPNIEAGNVLYKSLTLLCSAQMAGIIVGAQVPIVLTSRSDSAQTKLRSIVLGAYLGSRSEATPVES